MIRPAEKQPRARLPENDSSVSSANQFHADRRARFCRRCSAVETGAASGVHQRGFYLGYSRSNENECGNREYSMTGVSLKKGDRIKVVQILEDLNPKLPTSTVGKTGTLTEAPDQVGHACYCTIGRHLTSS